MEKQSRHQFYDCWRMTFLCHGGLPSWVWALSPRYHIPHLRKKTLDKFTITQSRRSCYNKIKNQEKIEEIGKNVINHLVIKIFRPSQISTTTPGNLFNMSFLLFQNEIQYKYHLPLKKGKWKHILKKHCQRHYGPRRWLLWPVILVWYVWFGRFGLVGLDW